MNYYPVALDLCGRKVVVIGGGEEAAAKVQRLVPCGPELMVVTPAAVAPIRDLAAGGALTWLRRAYRHGDLGGARLAIVCDDADAGRVRAEAETENVLLNVVDRPSACDFLAVAHFNREGLQIAIHASGQSAALSRRLRERLQACIGQPYGQLVRTLGELRPLVKTRIPTAGARRSFWLDVVAEPLLQRVDTGDFDPDAFKAEVLARAASVAS